MADHSKSNHGLKFRPYMLGAASVAALCFGAQVNTAYAQETVTVDSEEVQTEDDDVAVLDTVNVRAQRNSLKSAQDLKRDANIVVDAISAADVGIFPDKSVAEALQRLPGVSVDRYVARNDTSHFSAEPNGVLVRGLRQVRSEFNGRDTFSASSSRGLSWGDISPYMLKSVETYKSQSAELVEGGIAGSINLKTRVPFDQEGRLLVFNAGVDYDDQAKKGTPEYSGIFSDRWSVSHGEFGFLANVAYSEALTNNISSINDTLAKYDAGVYSDYGVTGEAYIPSGLIFRNNTLERERTGISLAGQYQNNAKNFLATAQYTRSDYESNWQEFGFNTRLTDSPGGVNATFSGTGNNSLQEWEYAAENEGLMFDENGFFVSGTGARGFGWQGSPNSGPYYTTNSAGDALLDSFCTRGWSRCPDGTLRGFDYDTETRVSKTSSSIEDFGFNVKYTTPDDRWRLNFDAQYVTASLDDMDISQAFRMYATPFVDLSGGVPRVRLIDELGTPPDGFEADDVWLNPDTQEGVSHLAVPSNYALAYVMDHLEDTDDSDQIAFKADAEYVVDGGWIDSVKFGGRVADREQLVRATTYNWESVVRPWSCNFPYYNVTNTTPQTVDYADRPVSNCLPYEEGTSFTFNGWPENGWVVGNLGNPNLTVPGGNLVFPNPALLQDHATAAAAWGSPAVGFPESSGIGWEPMCSNFGDGDRAEEIPGTCFEPDEIIDIREQVFALYAQLNFGGPDAELFGVPYSGNVGLRYVNTNDQSAGTVRIGSIGAETGAFDCEARTQEVQDPNDPNGTIVVPADVPQTLGCYLSPDDVTFFGSGSIFNETEFEHTNWLPSFNIKFDLNDEMQLRFAANKAMSRPDIGNLRNFVAISPVLPDYNDLDDPLWVKDGDGNIVGANVLYSGRAQNPGLKPIEATQFDATFEWYFDEVGSLTAGVFFKDFDNYISQAAYRRDITSGGVTRSVELIGPVNGEGAQITGFELAYQQFYDDLPAPFDGLGLKANYTYLSNEGIENTGVSPDRSDPDFAEGRGTLEVDRLEGLSDHTFNIVGMYEKGPISARLGYNWRSEFLITPADVILFYPVHQEAQGLLDGSIRWNVNDHIQVSLKGSNLLDEEFRTVQQFEDASAGGRTYPAAFHDRGRRFQADIRVVF